MESAKQCSTYNRHIPNDKNLVETGKKNLRWRQQRFLLTEYTAVAKKPHFASRIPEHPQVATGHPARGSVPTLPRVSPSSKMDEVTDHSGGLSPLGNEGDRECGKVRGGEVGSRVFDRTSENACLVRASLANINVSRTAIRMKEGRSVGGVDDVPSGIEDISLVKGYVRPLDRK